MRAEELWKKYLNRQHPEEIFAIQEAFEELSADEKEQFRKLANRDQVAMQYSIAVEMKKEGTWEDYVKEWKKNREKTSEERLKEYMSERGIIF